MKKKYSIRKICILAVLTAITAILGIYLTFRIGNQIKIPTKFVSVFMTGALFGPIAGGIVAAIADILNAVIMPVGAFLPQITAVEFLCGVIYGICFYKVKNNGMYYLRASVCAFVQFIISMTIMSKILVDVGYFPSFGVACAIRALPEALLFVIQMVTFCVLKRFVFKIKDYIAKEDIK